MKKTRAQMFGYSVNLVLLLLIAITTLYPFWHVFMYSISNAKQATSGGLFFWPRGISLLAYKLLFQTNQIFVAFWNSTVVTAVGTLISLAFSALTAFPLSIRRFKGRKTIAMLIFFTMLFNGGMIPNYLVVKSLGLLDSLWSLMLPGAISAYYLFIMRNFFQGLPESLEESARIDGANPLTILVKIVVPLSGPAFAALGMFYGVAKWNSYINAVLYINDLSKQVLQIYLRSLLASTALGALSGISDFAESANLTEEAMKMATIFASIIPVLLVYPWLQKYYVKGVIVGSVKG